MIYQNVQHKKEMVYAQSYQPFKGQRPQERPNSFLACGSMAEVAEIGWEQQPPSPFPFPSPSAVHVRARSSARALMCCAQTAQCYMHLVIAAVSSVFPPPFFNMMQSRQKGDNHSKGCVKGSSLEICCSQPTAALPPPF